MKRFFNIFTSSKPKPLGQDELDDFQWYLNLCEDLFFERPMVHSLDTEHRKTLLVAASLFYPNKDNGEFSNRKFVFKFLKSRYRYSDEEIQEYMNEFPLDHIFDKFNDLPHKSKIGILLFINCLLNIDKNATAREKELSLTIYSVLEIDPFIYRELMKNLDEQNKDKWFTFIHKQNFF